MSLNNEQEKDVLNVSPDKRPDLKKRQIIALVLILTTGALYGMNILTNCFYGRSSRNPQEEACVRDFFQRASFLEKNIYYVLLLLAIVLIILAQYKTKKYFENRSSEEVLLEKAEMLKHKENFSFWSFLGLILSGIFIFLVYLYFKFIGQ